MIQKTKIVSQALTGLVGAVVAMIAVACVLIVPLRAQQSPSGTTCDDDACTCATNMKTLGIALFSYTEDYDEDFPPGLQGDPKIGVGWFGPVTLYYGRAYYTCPSDMTIAAKPQYAFSYGFNSNLAGRSIVPLTAPDLTVSAFELSGTPIDAPLYDEGASQGATVFSAASNGLDGSLLAGKYGTLVPGVTYATGSLGYRAFLTKNSQFPSATGRHYTGANYAFADGHAGFFYPNDISSGTPAPSPDARQSGDQSGHAAGTLQSSFKATFSPI